MITLSAVTYKTRGVLATVCYRYASINRAPLSSTMSQVPSTSTSSTSFETIFTAALNEYKKQTKTDIVSHPLATQLQSCGSPSAIIAMLRTQVQTFDKGSDERWTKWLGPTVNVLFTFSATLGGGVGMVNTSYVEPARIYALTCPTTGIPTSECNLFWNWCPSSSELHYSHIRAFVTNIS